MTRSARPLEREVLSSIRLALGLEPDLVLWRNNVGVATHVTTHVGRGLGTCRVVYGLCPGSADLVGLLAPSGRFLGLEVKRPGEKPTPAQVQWLDLVRGMGGFAAVVSSVDEALAAVARAGRGARE